jgi:hypothetical protein
VSGPDSYLAVGLSILVTLVIKNMEITLSKKTIGGLILFLWLVFSIVYITSDIWNNYKKVQLAAAYNQGKTDTINALIEETDKCQPVSIFGEEKETQLMKLDCPAN